MPTYWLRCYCSEGTLFKLQERLALTPTLIERGPGLSQVG